MLPRGIIKHADARDLEKIVIIQYNETVGQPLQELL